MWRWKFSGLPLKFIIAILGEKGPFRSASAFVGAGFKPALGRISQGWAGFKPAPITVSRYHFYRLGNSETASDAYPTIHPLS
jgi:hypothetical protein